LSGLVSKVYRNDGGLFTDIGAGLTGVYYCSLAWGDYDNDGDLDLALAGYDGARVSKVYQNTGGAFTEMIGAGLTGVFRCSLAWGDYDNDGDLDLALAGASDYGLVSKIYRNDGGAPNTVPSAPTSLSASVIGGDATFGWDAAADGQTPAAGLSYNLRVGSAPGKDDVFCGMANLTTGLRRLPDLGNAQKNLSWAVKGLDPGVYYWSVQAVDTAFAGSSWAGEQTADTGVDMLKRKEDGASVSCGGAVVSAAFADFFYIEADDRSSGIRVDKAGHGLSAGMRADVSGVMSTNADGERYIDAATAVQCGYGTVEPLVLVIRAVGGEDWEYVPPSTVGQQGVKYGSGLNNIGLLIAATGRVTYVGVGHFYVDDGSGVCDDSGSAGIKVLAAGLTLPLVDQYVKVTGISSCLRDGADLYRLVRVRDQADIVVLE